MVDGRGLNVETCANKVFLNLHTLSKICILSAYTIV